MNRVIPHTVAKLFVCLHKHVNWVTSHSESTGFDIVQLFAGITAETLLSTKVLMGISDHYSESVRSDTDAGSVSAPSPSVGFMSGTRSDQTCSSMSFPKCSHKVGDVTLPKMSRYAEASGVPLTWKSATPQAHFHLAQCSQTSTTTRTDFRSWWRTCCVPGQIQMYDLS